MKGPLNRSSAQQIIRFFDVCFKHGVVDAYELRDDYEVKAFYEQHRAAWDFGILGEPDDYDWEMWRFALYRWARYSHLTTFAERYIYKISKKNYLWYFLPFCMLFYLMGIQEWLDNPNPQKLELFKRESRVHWKAVPKSVRKITTNDMIAYMVDWAYEYRRVPENERQMSTDTFESFCRAMHDLTRQYEGPEVDGWGYAEEGI